MEDEAKKNNPGRWYRTTNYDLRYMKKLQDQRNRIIKFEHDAMKEKPASVRGAKCFYYTCKGAFCNIQTAILLVLFFISLGFFVASVIIDEKRVDDFDPIVIDDSDPTVPLVPSPEEGGTV